MSDTIITVEKLGKRYSLRHQSNERYATLRDVLTSKAKGLFRRTGNDSEADPTVEEFWALKDVSFEVKQGEVLGIIGRNGAGKSTLLKILSRITEPTEGKVRIKGRVASLLEVGTGFHPELTGRENIFLNGAILGMSRAEIKAKFGEIVAFAEVEKFLDTPMKRYSSGMYVRLAFAIAAHLEPDILMVDEVLAVGDAEFQKKCLGRMQEVAQGQGRTVLFVSHNLNAVSSLCDTAFLLDSGKLKFQGSVESAIETYSNATQPQSIIRLLEHRGRATGKRPLFKLLRLLDAAGSAAESFAPASEICLEFELVSGWCLKSPMLSVAFSNWKGDRVFAVGSFLGPIPLRAIEGQTKVTARFQLPPLFPGIYQMDIGAYDSIEGNIDEIYSAGSIEVNNCNYLRMTHVPSHELGVIMVRSRWLIGDVSDSLNCEGNVVACDHASLMPPAQ